MKNKEWLKAQIKHEEVDLKHAFDNYVPYEKVLIADDVNELLNQLEEPQLPVIPQFVAEVIEKYKEHDDSLGELLASVEHATIKYYHNMEKYRVDFNNLYKTGVDICAIIARAWLDGFVVEKYRRVLKIGKMYFVSGGANHEQEFNIKLTDNKESAYVFESEQEAKDLQSDTGGKLEEI